MLAVENAAAGVLQGSTPHESPPSVAAPAAAPNLAKVAEPTAPPTPVDTEMKPPAPRDANRSTAAGSPADSEKAPPAAVAAAAPAPPKPKPLVAAPLLDPPRTYEKDAKTIRALISLGCIKVSLGNGSHSSSSRLFSTKHGKCYAQVRPYDRPRGSRCRQRD